MAHLDRVITPRCLRGLLAHERASLAHVLDCPECAAMVGQALAAAGDGEEDPGPYDAGYEEAFERALERTRGNAESAPAQTERARELLAALLVRPPESWPAVVVEGPEYRSAVMAVLLLEQARDCVDPLKSEALAVTGLQVARNLEAGAPASLRADLVVRSFTLIAHARSRRHDWQGADSAFEEARNAMPETPDSSSEALYCRLLGQSFRERGRMPEALALLAWAARLYGATEEVEDELSVLDQQALVHLERGDFEQAAVVLAVALTRARAAGFSRLGLRRRLLSLLASDEPASVLEGFLLESAGLLLEGRTQAAEERLKSVVDGLAWHGEAIIAAFAALDLAGLYLRENRAASLAELAPALEMLSRSEELSAPSRSALELLHVALRDQVGGIEPLLCAAVAAIETHDCPDLEVDQPGAP
jgi:tetratricopeptide (TPR) repeat protein